MKRQPGDFARLPPPLTLDQRIDQRLYNSFADGTLLASFKVEVRATKVTRDSVEFEIVDLGYKAVGRWTILAGLDCEVSLPASVKTLIVEKAYDLVTKYRYSADSR